MPRHNVRTLVFLAFLIFFGSPVLARGPQDTGEHSSSQAVPTLPPSALPPGVYAVKKKKLNQTPQSQQVQDVPPQSSTNGAPQSVTPSQATPQRGSKHADQGATRAYVVERVLGRKLGSQGLQRLLGEMDAMTAAQAGTGKGAPNSDIWFDGAQVRTGDDEGVRPAGTQFFQRAGSGSQSAEGAPAISSAYKRATVQDAQQTTGRYGSIPGGVVLEGIATGLGDINSVRYDRRFNAFILDDSAVYFMKVPPQSVAVLCRAIAEDEMERVGVSLGQTALVYGKVPEDADLAWDLKIADHFLASIVFAWKDWMSGYRFADGFKPDPNPGGSWHGAVFFKFNGFQFQVSREEAKLTNANLDVQLLPLSQSMSADGELLPDETAISQGRIPEQYEHNAKHVAEHIAYYRRERIIDQMFVYGEVAAFIRELKREGFDLVDLANHIPGDR